MDTGVRVTFVVDSPNRGGAEAYVAALLRRLPERFARTLVATAPVPPPLARAAQAGGRLVMVDPVGARWRRAPALARAVRATRPDLVHVNAVDLRSNRVPLAVAAAAGSAAVATVHMRGTTGTGASRRLLGRVYRRLDGVVVVSAEIRGLLVDGLDVPAERVRLVRNGVEPAQPRPPRTRGGAPLAVGGLGRLTSQKGFDLLVEATRRLVAEGWPVEVRIAGEGRELAALEAAAAGLPVRLVGFVDDPAAHLAGLDVFCLPSRAEGLPFALLEAMTAGLPCVASATGEISAAVGGTALLVPPGDVDALTGALRRLLGDPRLRETLGAAGQELARRRFDVAGMVAGTVAVYQRALDGRPLSPGR